MITFEEAVRIAKDTREIDYFQEYKDVYVFGKKKYMTKSDDASCGIIGGYDMPFIVMKSSGKVFGYSYIAVTQSQKLFEENLIKEGDL